MRGAICAVEGFSKTGPRGAFKMIATTHHRTSLTFPSFTSLSSDTRDRLRRCGAMLNDLQPPDLTRWSDIAAANATPAWSRGLEHELSPWIEARLSTRSVSHLRSVTEATTLRQGLLGLDAALGSEDPRNLEACLDAMASEMQPNVGRRSGAIGTRPDRQGDSIAFPPPGEVAMNLAKIFDLMKLSDAPGLYTAGLLLAAVTNCHPMTDCNGRLARIIANYALIRRGMPENVYIPFYEIFKISRGGYEIRLRMGEIQGEWDGFFDYMCLLISISQHKI